MEINKKIIYIVYHEKILNPYKDTISITDCTCFELVFIHCLYTALQQGLMTIKKYSN
jgi:hypothetical protein